MKECIDEGTLQAYFDGELDGPAVEHVASHLATCNACALTARELETENQLLSEALSEEFAVRIPSESLRNRIDAAIAGLETSPTRQTESTTGNWFQALIDLFKISPQRTFAYASLAAIVVFAGIFGIVYFKRDQSSPETNIAQNKPSSPVAAASPAVPLPIPTESPAKPANDKPVRAPQVAINRRPSRPRSTNNGELLPGERRYVDTIAALNAKLKTDNGRPMRPGLQVEYERNLAVVDNAIAQTRDVARKNPGDPNAAQFMYSAYQSKVNLLNQVADARNFNGRE
jgi:anti-sigma factor RsiW